MFSFLKYLFGIKSKSTEPLVSLSDFPSAKEGGRDSPFEVKFDETGFSLYFEDTLQNTIKWGEIELVAIRIEDDFLPFPYWYVGNKENLLRIPSDAKESEALFFDGFKKYLAGYENDATYQMITEASIAIEGSFIVWEAEKT